MGTSCTNDTSMVEKTSTPYINERIMIDKCLHVTLTYKSFCVHSPEWFRSGHNCKLTKFPMLENLSPHIKYKTGRHKHNFRRTVKKAIIQTTN